MEISLLQLAPPTWTRTTLGEIVARGGGSIQTGPFGSQLHASDYVPEGVPSIMPVNIGENRLIRDGIACIRESDAQRLSKHIVRKGDIIYSRRGDVERRAIVRESEDGWFCGTGCLKVRLGQGVIVPEFAAFYLGHPEVRSWIVRHAVGITMPNLNTSIMEEVPFLLPPLDEQHAIAETLQSLDDKIEQNRRTGRKLEGLARAVFKAWFVDFEPVKAKVAGATRFPGMPPETFATLPARFVNSELGPVPVGWSVESLEEIAEAVKGLSYKGAGLVAPDDPDVSSALPLHNLNSVYEGGGYKNEGIKRYRGEFKDRHIIHPGDLIVTNTEQGHEYRLIGYPAIVPKRFGDRGLFSHHIFRVRPLSDAPVGMQYLYYSIMSGRIRDEIVGCTNGTTVNMLSIDGLKRPRLCVPPREVATIFEERASAMYALSESLIDESTKLATLRDYLLPQLLSGKVQVSKAEQTVTKAV